MKMISTLAVVASGSLAMAAQGTLIAYWNFNDFDTSATNIAADHGSGNIDLSGWGGGVTSFAGSTINALFDDPSGGSLVLQGGEDLAGNGTYIEITFSMAGLQDLHVSFATRGTSTGFDTGIWRYNVGDGWIDFPHPNTATRSTSYELAEFYVDAGVNDAATVALRYYLDGAESAAGNNRIDNLQLNASAIPAPGAFALLGLAGLVGVSRRRRA